MLELDKIYMTIKKVKICPKCKVPMEKSRCGLFRYCVICGYKR